MVPADYQVCSFLGLETSHLSFVTDSSRIPVVFCASLFLQVSPQPVIDPQREQKDVRSYCSSQQPPDAPDELRASQSL